MGQVDAGGIARRGIGIEHEALAVGEDRRTLLEGAKPQLRALQIDENADRAIITCLDIADGRDELTHLVMRGVAHIDAENIRPRLE